MCYQVEVGQIFEQIIEVKTGLTEGTSVVTSNVNNLKDGDSLLIAK